jgi:DNA polymerase III alpha subunit
MRDLIPDRFEHLIAMNALYRPGPIAYIPAFIRRKNGLEEIPMICRNWKSTSLILMELRFIRSR